MPLESVLDRIDRLLNRVEPDRPNRRVMTEQDLPQPKPGPAAAMRFVEYPHRNEQQPGSLWFVWPAERDLNVTEQTLLALFLEAVAGDPTTNMYRRFIDSRTREIDLGAQSVFGSLIEEQGFPVILGFGDVPVSKMNEREMADLRSRVRSELERIAAWEDGSAELAEFNERLRSRVIGMRRNLAKFVNSPPGFGFRGAGQEWLDHLELLNEQSGFQKSLTMRDILGTIDRTMAENSNVWRRRLFEWKLVDVEPWVMATKPDPGIIDKDQKDRQARVAEELERIMATYGVENGQEALQRYRTEYDANSAVIELAAIGTAAPKFAANPPMTLDDQLQFDQAELENRIPIVTSTFESMTSATTGIALRLDGVPEDQLIYVSMLPQLLSRVGVIENGRVVPYEEMSERLRKEILYLNADFSTNVKTGRVELVIRGAGNDAAEAQKAIQWMRLVLFHTDWRRENLPRIRDLVDQTLGNMRRTMQTAEENWVRGVANAWWRQDNPLLLTTTSFMTQTHNVQRLRWMLKDATLAERTAAARSLNELADVGGGRTGIETRLSELQAGQDKLLADAAGDLGLTLADIPDSSLAADWPRLTREMANDLASGPERALTALDMVRQQLLRSGNARLFLISSTATHIVLKPAIQELVQGLSTIPAIRPEYSRTGLVRRRLLERDPGAGTPLFVGLLNPNSQGGVFLNSAPLTGYEDTDRENLLDYLSANLYGGGGGHSIFMKTWSAGLAYSNGIGARLTEGRIGYYAERTPELPQTLQFVIRELQRAAPDDSLVEYAIAQSFGGTRSASPYEARGEQMAANLADGLSPGVVRRFHEQILELRGIPGLATELFQRMNRVYARVLPGMGANAAAVPDAVYFVIGPEKQLAAWEDYLRSVEGVEAKLHRLYPRDFWMN
jgi:Zn-dependent M16 (insulinase) family peptidase